MHLETQIFPVHSSNPTFVKFSIMDFYLATCRQVEFSGYLVEDLRLIDIGKPETLAKAEGFCTGTLHSDA